MHENSKFQYYKERGSADTVSLLNDTAPKLEVFYTFYSITSPFPSSTNQNVRQSDKDDVLVRMHSFQYYT